MGLEKRLVLEKNASCCHCDSGCVLGRVDEAFLVPEPDLYACIEMVAARHARDG